MRNLTLRIFLSFWLVIGVLVALAAAGGYAYSERLRQAFEDFDAGDDIVVEASTVLQSGDRAGLTTWLRERPPGTPFEVFVVDADGRDLLGRRLPFAVQRILRRFDGREPRREHRNRRHWRADDRPNLRRARPITRLISSTGDVYSVFVAPKRNPFREWIAARAGPVFLLFALTVSGLASFALARAITRPVKSFREATFAIADGQFDTRVAETMRKRRDDIGLLAHDLDAMAAKLKRSAKQQTELTRNISHELRSPLARLRVALELARREAGDRNEFSRIDQEAERLDALIGQLLSFSRLDGDDGEQAQLVNLSSLLEEAVANANYECRSSDIDTVTVALSGERGLSVRGYVTALMSAFDNVLRNAIHHSPADSTVSVQVSATDTTVTVAIEDQGAGVPETDLPHLFEPFFRSTAAPAERPAGSGLGLAIAERAITKNAGRISAARAAGGGLRVSIELPRR